MQHKNLKYLVRPRHYKIDSTSGINVQYEILYKSESTHITSYHINGS